jgi:hypothetical protein
MNHTLLSIGLFLLHIYSSIKIHISMAWAYIYNNSVFVQHIVAGLHTLMYELKRYFYSCRIEPPYPYWSVFCDGNELIVPISTLMQDNIIAMFNMLLNSFQNTTINLNGEYLLMMRVNDGAIISRIYDETKDDYEIVLEKSRKHFLSVEYTHPDMPNRIVLDLDPSLYLVGNEVFTAGFVQRCLEYQTEYYIFDDNYVLDIMDSKIKMLTLKKGEHIIIGKTEYEKRV